LAIKMRAKSKKSADAGAHHESGYGRALGNFKGFAHSRITAHFQASRAAYSTTTCDPANVHLGRERQTKDILKDLRRKKANWQRAAAKDMAKAMERKWKEYANA
jgi:hypothetical protein